MPDTMVGKLAPAFALNCIGASESDPHRVALETYSERWLMLVFYPRDFTFVCPTELTAFSARITDFHNRDCDLLGVSADTIDLHREWLTTPADEGGLGPLQFPLASDPDGTAARAFGVWVDEKCVSTRGLFLIDPNGILQYAVVHNLSVGRSPDEVLRVLTALQTGGLCPASWTEADGTIDPERALQPGRILGHYRIRRQLGGGSFGTVFAAWDMRLERMVALKVLKRTVFESRDAALGEARTAAKLNHVNVCTVHAVDEEDGLPVIVMEYLDGRPLSQVIAADIAPEVTADYARQVALGLAAAHEQDVVHGDLKPGNIMVSHDGIAKILDFGLARSQPPADSPDSGEFDCLIDSPETATPDIPGGIADTIEYIAPPTRKPSSIVGTPAYMSPEQSRGYPATPASDVFAFGVTLCEMLTGQPAFSNVKPLEHLVRLQSEEVSGDLIPKVPEQYQPLLSTILNRDPALRPTMAAVVQTLDTIANDEL